MGQCVHTMSGTSRNTVDVCASQRRLVQIQPSASRRFTRRPRLESGEKNQLNERIRIRIRKKCGYPQISIRGFISAHLCAGHTSRMYLPATRDRSHFTSAIVSDLIRMKIRSSESCNDWDAGCLSTVAVPTHATRSYRSQ